MYFRGNYGSTLSEHQPLFRAPIMALESQTVTTISPSRQDRAIVSPTDTKYFAVLTVLVTFIVQSVVLVYVYVFLWSFHLLYTASIRAIMHNISASPSSKTLESLLGGVTKLCYVSLAVGAFCVGTGVYIAQNSYEPAPETWGPILMIAGIDALLNTLAILVTISTIVIYPQLNYFDERSIRRVARILAVPVSSLIWCLVFFAISLISYITQPNAPQLQVDPQVVYGTDLQLYRKPKPAYSSEHSYDHPTTLQLSSPSNVPNPPFIAEHNSPLLARLAFGLMVAVATLRFMFVVYSTTRLQNIFAPPFEPQAGSSSLANHVDCNIRTGGANAMMDAPSVPINGMQSH